jgi:hypothetical protein
MNRRALSRQYINCLSSRQFSCKGDDWHATLHISMHAAWSPRPGKSPNRPMFDTWVYRARLGGLDVPEIRRLGCLILLALCQLIAPELKHWDREGVCV